MVYFTTSPQPVPQDTLTPERFATVQLFFVLNSSASRFWKLLTHFGSAAQALQAHPNDWQKLGVHANHVAHFSELKRGNGSVCRRIDDCQTAIAQGYYSSLFYDDMRYPKQLNVLHDKPPILFLRGNSHILNQAQIAIVGTRKPSQAARKICETFACHFAQEGLWVTSGLADGIDSHAHMGALNQRQGRTIAVLGNGITGCYPRSNQRLYDRIVAEGGAVISEFFPDASPAAHHFPRRNRIVSGLGLATLVVEAARQSGSLITANFAAEQGKTVFAIPGHIYNTQSQGCHQLIREGAILVDDPSQVIEDINLPRRLHADILQADDMTPGETADLFADSLPLSKTAETNGLAQPSSDMPNLSSPETDIPAHLYALLNQLDWVGQDMDALINITGLPVAELSSQLMELELMGLLVQQGGLYLRCRP